MIFRRKSQEGYSYGHAGELEANGVDRLPPTAISHAAEQTFKRMGLSDQQISEIRNFCAQFRYDRCTEKVERLTRNKVYVKSDPTSGTETANFPFFYDINGRLDGQCGDIAKQFLIQAELSGLLEDLNTNTKLKPGYRIITSFSLGHAKTYFINEGRNHLWNEIILLNEKNEIVESVLVDASFQRIMTQSESGYVKKATSYDPIVIKDAIIGESVLVGRLEIDGDNITGTIPNPIVLGVSNDRKYVYALGFTREKDHPNEKLIPTLTRTQPNEKTEVFILNPSTGKLINDRTHNKSLTRSERREIESILTACSRFEYTDDFSSYPLTAGNVHTIGLRKARE